MYHIAAMSRKQRAILFLKDDTFIEHETVDFIEALCEVPGAGGDRLVGRDFLRPPENVAQEGERGGFAESGLGDVVAGGAVSLSA